MKEACLDLEHSFPFPFFLEIEHNKISEKPHDRPDISRIHKCTYQLLAKGKGPKGEEAPMCPTLMAPATPQTGSYSSLENVCLNR